MLLIERKRQIKNQRSRSTEYTELKKEAQKALRMDKEKWLEEKCTEAEEKNRRHNISGVHQTIKELIGKRTGKQMSMKDEDGTVLTNTQQGGKNTQKICTETLKVQDTEEGFSQGRRRRKNHLWRKSEMQLKS